MKAATGSGARVVEGPEGFRGLFAETVEGKRPSRRQARCLASAPTDEQAEVLVPAGIAAADILGIAVCDAAQARRVSAKWRNAPGAPRVWLVPEYYDPYRLTGLLRTGRRPDERPWDAGRDA